MKKFLLFCISGAIGFVVDAATLQLLLTMRADYYSSRAVSIFAAIVTTWLINRRLAFRAEATQQAIWQEFFKYFSAMLIGACINYATYALLILCSLTVARYPILGVAAGSITGLTVNFCSSLLLIFKKQKK